MKKIDIGKRRAEQLARAFNVHPAIIMFPSTNLKRLIRLLNNKLQRLADRCGGVVQEKFAQKRIALYYFFNILHKLVFTKFRDTIFNIAAPVSPFWF